MEELELQDFSRFKEFYEVLKLHGNIPEDQMSFEEQMTRLSMKYEISDHKIYTDEDEDGEQKLITVPLFKIEGTKIKSRRIVQMGTYYFAINPAFITDPPKALLFYNKLDDGKIVKATHPHISDNGIPCLGEFQRQTNQLVTGNIMFIVTLAKKFLGSHYYRSTYHNLRDNYDMDIIGVYKPSIEAGEDDQGNRVMTNPISEKVRIMGWDLARQLRHTREHTNPLRITSYRADKVNGYLIKLYNRLGSFPEACKALRSLRRDLRGIEDMLESIDKRKFDDLHSWGYMDLQIRSMLHYEGGKLDTSRLDNTSTFIRQHITKEERELFRQYNAATNGEDSIEYFTNQPYINDLSEEDLEFILENHKWPDALKRDNSAVKMLRKKCIKLYNDLEVSNNQLAIKHLRKQILQLGGTVNEEPKVNHPPRDVTTNRLSFEEIPQF